MTPMATKSLKPHRDLYELKKELPSNWNAKHKTFWLPEQAESPCTLSLKDTILEAIPAANILVLRVLNHRWGLNTPFQPKGEYSIEAVVLKDAKHV